MATQSVTHIRQSSKQQIRASEPCAAAVGLKDRVIDARHYGPLIDRSPAALCAAGYQLRARNRCWKMFTDYCSNVWSIFTSFHVYD